MKSLSFEYEQNRQSRQQAFKRRLIHSLRWWLYFGTCIIILFLVITAANIIIYLHPDLRPIWTDYGWVPWLILVVVIGLPILNAYVKCYAQFENSLVIGANVRITLDTEGYTYDCKYLHSRISWAIISKVRENDFEFMFISRSSGINLRFFKQDLTPGTVEEIRKFIRETILPVLASNNTSDQ